MNINILLVFTLLGSCSIAQSVADKKIDIVNDNQYWYNNEAEISSYKLSQARYGEIHQGTAVLVFVTEPFSTKSWTKSDDPDDSDISVLKLNSTKKFNTGIYPYSMMTSTFFPFENGEHSLKVTSSTQEWCGHTFTELKNEEKFKIQLFSYFEGEELKKSIVKKSILEDDIWSMIRLNPSNLPKGNAKIIPSFFYLRLLHQEIRAYDCELSTSMNNDSIVSYSMHYPDLERTLTIKYEVDFPYTIDSWEETCYSGWGDDRKLLTTSAEHIQTVKSDYWNKHSNKDLTLRTKLGLD